jgi:hypothetical protein
MSSRRLDKNAVLLKEYDNGHNGDLLKSVVPLAGLSC